MECVYIVTSCYTDEQYIEKVFYVEKEAEKYCEEMKKNIHFIHIFMMNMKYFSIDKIK